VSTSCGSTMRTGPAQPNRNTRCQNGGNGQGVRRKNERNPRWLAIVLFGVFPSAVAAQSSTPPLTASVVVRLTAGTSTYHVGEHIRFELEFRGVGDADYYFGDGVCGPFGRLSSEQVVVIPSENVEDPLADVFGSSGYAGSCLSSFHELDATPLVIVGSLTDWFRFTRPGRYAVVVSSTRLQRHSGHAAPVLTSAPVYVSITPAESGWAAAEALRGSDLLDRGDAADGKLGAAILRDLGTEAAARALLERYATGTTINADAIETALIASPYRTLIVGELAARVDRGDDLPSSFFATLARVRVLQELPRTASNAAARWRRMTVVQAEYDARWRAAIARRPITAATLVTELERLARTPPVDIQVHIARDLDQHPAEAAEAFAALSSATQTSLLVSTTNWRWLKQSWTADALRRVYSQWVSDAVVGGLPDGGVGDAALMRLSDVAPDDWRRLVLEEIRTGAHGITYSTLATLPDAELPALSSALQARYEVPPGNDFAAKLRDRGTTAWLIARYGAADLVGFVGGLIARPIPSCEVEGALIAFLMKRDPAPAVARLDRGFDRSTGRVCVAPLAAVAAHYWDARVESAAIALLIGTDVRAILDAVNALERNGSHDAKRPLLDRLARWSAEWQGREAELDAMQLLRTTSSPDMIESGIVNALFQNDRFQVTTEDVAAIEALCVTDRCRTTVDANTRARRH